MNEQRKDELDQALVSAFANEHVTQDLKASTMARIAAARAEQTADATDQDAGSPAARQASALAKRAGIVQMPRSRKAKLRLLFATAAAILCLVIAASGIHVLYNTETAQAAVISSTAQAGVNLGVNRFNRVVSATAQQADRQSEIDALGLIHMDYETAISTLTASGFLDSGKVDVQIGSSDLAQTDSLVTTTTVCLENAGCSGSCNGQGYGKHQSQSNGQGAGQGNGCGQGMGMHHAGADE